MNSRSVRGSVVLITGAASGMGRATAEVFAAEGAHVACTDIAAESVREVADHLAHRGLSAEAWTLDVSDPAAIDLVTAGVAAFPRIVTAMATTRRTAPNPTIQRATRATRPERRSCESRVERSE